MNRLLLATIILALFSPGIHAQNYNPKFDQGIDLAEFRKAATEDLSQQTCIPFPSIELKVAKEASINKVVLLDFWKKLKAGPGYIGGPYDTIVLNNRAYQNALLRVSLLGQQPEHPTVHALLTEWQSIETTRSGLLSEAGILNNRDSALYREGVEIDNAAAAFANEKASLEKEIASYNAQCPGQTSTECHNWYNSLVAKIANYNGRVETHNQKVKVWRSNVQSLKNSVSTWFAKVQEWETKILYFIRQADAFLSGQIICVLLSFDQEIGWIGQPPNQKPIYYTHCAYTCANGHDWPVTIATATLPFRPCPKTVIEGEIPIKSIKRQNPDFTEAIKLLK